MYGNNQNLLYPELSERIIGGFLAVKESLGPGLLETPYHNALYYELQTAGLQVIYNVPFSVTHQGYTVGEYFADLVVESRVIIEVKAVSALSHVHHAQLINYLRISGLKLGFLVNFGGTKVYWKRLVV